MANEFFSGTHQQRPVYLDLEEETLARLGSRLGLDGATAAAKSLQAAVVGSLLSVDAQGGAFAQHLDWLEEWRARGRRGPPPVLALLAFFSLVAESMHGDEDFAPHNYYGRLAHALRISLDPHHQFNKLQTQFRRDTPLLWNALRAWLTQNDGSLGIPTAEAFDRRAYIGLPMSQALLRAADREKLPEFFAHYRLRPGQSVAAEDMRRLLGEWMAASSFSIALKQLWGRSQEAARRIAAIASIELENWDGVSETVRTVGPARRAAALILAARLRSTTRQIFFELIVQGSSDLTPGRYLLENTQAEAAASAFQDINFEISLPPSERRAWVTIPESAAIRYPDLLLGFACFRHEHQSTTLERSPSCFIALERVEEHEAFLEVANITLCSDLLLLAHQSLAGPVEEIVRNCSRPGWRLFQSDQIRGLPDDWWLFAGVQFLQVPQFDDERLHELAPLIPISMSQVVCNGGFSLAGKSRWHVEYPPELRFSTDEPEEISATLVELEDNGLKRKERTLISQFRGQAVLQLEPGQLSEGDYRAVIRDKTGKGDPIAATSFSLRSANAPVLVAPGSAPWVGASPEEDGPAFALRATTRPAPPDSGSWVCGLAMGKAVRPIPVASVSLSPEAWPDDLVDDRDHLSQSAIDHAAAPRSEGMLSCLPPGAHMFVFPSWDERLPPAQRPARQGTCRKCGYTKHFEKRRRRSRERSLTGPSIDKSRLGPSLIPTQLPEVAAPRRPGINTLLDALFFERFGTFQSFANRAAQISEEAWFPHETAALLSALGHIEVERDAGSLRPVRWAAMLTTLHALEAPGKTTVTGYRSEILRQRLQKDCRDLDLRFEVDRLGDGPDRWTIHSCDLPALSLICDSASESLGIDCRIVRNAHLRLAEALPDLSGILGVLPTREIPRGWRVEAYDVETNRWEAKQEIRPNHAYMACSQGQRLFGFVTPASYETSRMVIADYRTVKFLAAAAISQRLLSYDPASKILAARIGSPLPGLFERAAVSCSGLPPLTRHGGTFYSEVSEEVAHHILGKLSTLRTGDHVER